IVSYSPLVPVQYKLLWIDLMEIDWVAILSFIANDEKLASGIDPVAVTEENLSTYRGTLRGTSGMVAPPLDDEG
ncbi:MAG: hypothetical protein AAFU70_10745, partial [Planctomycetota bacterium]